jgi:2-polyprenyl-3-methyl-5-hydroxy-6-metoxy-1,4-benzoquinol methylase
MEHEFRFVTVSCDLCGSLRCKEIMRKRGALIHREFRIVRCSNCGFIYVNPRICDEHIPLLYDDAYWRGEGFDRTIGANADQKIAALCNADIVATVGEALGCAQDCRVLDVGCGLGHLVAAFLAHGAKAEGFDTSATARAACKESRVPVLDATRLDQLPRHCYDAVTAVEVIEHVISPTEFLNALRRVLRPQGVLFISTGNWNWVRRLPGTPYIMPEGHLQYFTPRILAKFFRKTEYEIDLRTLNRNWNGFRFMPASRTNGGALLAVRIAAKFFHLLIPAFSPMPLAKRRT